MLYGCNCASVGVAEDVAQTLASDAEGGGHDFRRSGEVDAHRELDGGGRRNAARRRFDAGQRAHILAQIVVLALNAALELREIGEHLIRRAGAELLARGLQPQVDTGERLRVSGFPSNGGAV